jgi:molybdate transport system substrate-binding protein
MKRKRPARLIAAVGVSVAVILGGAPTGVAVGSASPHAATKAQGEITVLAASSLTEAFTQIGTDFETANPDASVTFSFNASSTLVTQIQQGVPADVFASADESNMDKLVDGGQVTAAPTVFAHNRLSIAVAPGNPKHIKTLADTVDPEVTLVLCAPEVPCGKFAVEAYGNAGLDVPAVPYAANVKDAVSKVALGEADAAIVYTTDVKAAKGDIVRVKIPTKVNVLATYPAAPIETSQNPSTAKAFVKYLASTKGQATLRKFGFLRA